MKKKFNRLKKLDSKKFKRKGNKKKERQIFVENL